MRVATLSEQLLFVTVRLEWPLPDGMTGAATGFVYGVPTEHGSRERNDALILVTNRHVAEATETFVVQMVQRRPDQDAPAYGTAATMPCQIPRDAWMFHPDPEVDVAVVPFARVLNALISAGMPPFFRAVASSSALVPGVTQTLDASEEITFIGYPNNLYDQANLTPIVRRGTTATPTALDYDGQPSFLIDASVFPGSSGSPVFLHNSGTYSTRDGNVVAGRRNVLLGVLAAVHVREAPVRIVETSPGAVVQDPLNLGIVYRAEAIDACVDALLPAAGLRRVSRGPQPPEQAAAACLDPLTETSAPASGAGRAQSGYSSLRHARGSSGCGFGVRSSSMVK